MTTLHTKPQLLQTRLIAHASAILNISAKLAKTPQASHVSGNYCVLAQRRRQITAKLAVQKVGPISFTNYEL